MTYTMEDFKRDYVKEHFPKLTPEKRWVVLQALSPEEQCEALERLPPDRLDDILWLVEAQKLREDLESLPPEELRELLRALPLRKRLAGLSAEQVRQHFDQQTAGRPAKPRRQRRKK